MGLEGVERRREKERCDDEDVLVSNGSQGRVSLGSKAGRLYTLLSAEHLAFSPPGFFCRLYSLITSWPSIDQLILCGNQR